MLFIISRSGAALNLHKIQENLIQLGNLGM